MGTSYVPTSIQAGFQSNDALNNEFVAIAAELARMVNRFGDTPNFMETELDMNTNRILSVADGSLGTDGINLNQATAIAVSAASSAVQSGGGVQGVDFTDSNPLTFNYGTATGSQGLNNRTEFDMATLFGVGVFQGLTVIINGVVQTPALAYTVTNDTLVTLAESAAPASTLLFIYGDLSPIPVFSNAKATLDEVAAVATAGQTVFTAPTYVIGANHLIVTIDGLMQSLGLTDYAETSTTSITLDEPMVGGEAVVIREITGA